MNHKLVGVLLATAGFLPSSIPVFAHHSDSVFDQTRLVTIKGTVTRYDLINPHVTTYLDVTDDKGNVVQWICTGGAPNHQRRVGWTDHTLKPGDKLTISGFQYKDGRPIMLHVRVQRENGEVLGSSPGEASRYKEFLDKEAQRTH